MCEPRRVPGVGPDTSEPRDGFVLITCHLVGCIHLPLSRLSSIASCSRGSSSCSSCSASNSSSSATSSSSIAMLG